MRKALSHMIPWKSPTDGLFCLHGPFTREEARQRAAEMRKEGYDCANPVECSDMTHVVQVLDYLTHKYEMRGDVPVKDLIKLLEKISK